MDAVLEGTANISTAGKCSNHFEKKGNTKDPFELKANYGGIPEALILYCKYKGVVLLLFYAFLQYWDG